MVGHSPQQDQSIDDPESISQTQRIREILARRTRTLEARDEAKMETLLGDVDERRALLYYRAHLESLIYELWNVFRNLTGEESEDGGIEDVGAHYLNEKKIYEVDIDPPERLRRKVHEMEDGAAMPEPARVTIEGLRWFVQEPDTVSATFEVEAFDPPRTVREEREEVLGWQPLDAGLRNCLEFMDRAGVDAELAEDEQQTKITRELLEEVEEWREEHVDNPTTMEDIEDGNAE